MTTWAQSLIRISNYEVETLQKRLAEISDRKAQTEMRLAMLEAEAEGEQDRARQDVDAAMMLRAYLNGWKQKKAAVLHFLHEQISEAASGVGYLRRKSTLGPMRDNQAYHAGVEEWRRTEDRILLLKLLSLLVEHNGQLLEDPALARTVST